MVFMPKFDLDRSDDSAFHMLSSVSNIVISNISTPVSVFCIN